MTTFKTNHIVTEAKDLSKYGKDFQVKLLALLVKDRPFALAILPIIKGDYFTDVYLRTVFSSIKLYVEKYNSTPTLDNIKILLEDAGEKTKIYEQILKSINDIGLEDRDFVIANTQNFCFTKFALIEQEKVLIALKEGNFESAKKISMESFRHSNLDATKHFDLHENYKIIFDEEEIRCPIATPWPTFNQNMKGGLGAGDLGLIIAASNFGKSAALQALARHANFLGKNVVYFSYEMGGSAIFSRYIAGLIDVPQEELKFNKELIDSKLKEKGLGTFRVIQDKSSNATVAIIKNHVEHLKSTGFFADLLIVDGLNQMKLPPGHQWVKDDNAKYEILTEDLRDLCGDLQIPGWSSWQSNRLGYNSALNDIKTIGKAIEVFQKADVVITYAQTDEQKENSDCIAYLLKNRLGINQIALLCFYDPNKGVFIEKGLVNPRVLMDDSEKKKISGVVSNVREKLSAGSFEKNKR